MVPGERGGAGGHGRRGLDPQCRVLAQDSLFELLQLWPGVEPELVAQGAACAPEHREGIGLPPAAVEGEHQLSVQPLARRVGGHERLELGGERLVPREREVGGDSLLEHEQPQLLEARDLGPGELLVGDVLERRSAPQRERGAQRRRRRVRVARRELVPSARSEPLETLDVELVRLDS